GVQLAHILVREDVPVIFGAERHAGALRRAPDAPLVDGIADLPEIGRDLGFLPLALVVVPLVAAADPHARVLLALVLLEAVIGVRGIAAGRWVRRPLRCPGCSLHSVRV